MNNIIKPRVLVYISMGLLLFLTACNNSSDNSTFPPALPPLASSNLNLYSFEISVTNLTHAQPFSPLAIVSHNDSVLWQVGQPADTAIEIMAESGDNTTFREASGLLTGVSGGSLILPGMTQTLVISVNHTQPPVLTIATMLVNTNDAFTGATGIDTSNMPINDAMMMMVVAYDAGTEANSEAAGTIPGPADGGEGYNPVRDDVDFITYHPGVVGVDGGLSTSVLSGVHKFDNPVMKITITRLQ